MPRGRCALLRTIIWIIRPLGWPRGPYLAPIWIPPLLWHFLCHVIWIYSRGKDPTGNLVWAVFATMIEMIFDTTHLATIYSSALVRILHALVPDLWVLKLRRTYCRFGKLSTRVRITFQLGKDIIPQTDILRQIWVHLSLLSFHAKGIQCECHRGTILDVTCCWHQLAQTIATLILSDTLY